MLRKTILGSILVLLFCLSGCGDWRSGKYEGTASISAKSYYDDSTSGVVKPRSATVSFPHPTWVKLGDDTPIPDCTVTFSGADADDNKMSGFEGAWHKGETNSGQDCEAVLTPGIKTKIEFFQGSVTRADSGEIRVNLKFRPRDAIGDTSYEFEFQGKKGWF